MAGPDTLQFTDDNFEEAVLKAEQPVLVDFWAEWCGPCKALGPIIDQLATENVGKAKIGKIDTDANRTVSVDHSISAIPTVLLFHGGEMVEKFVGLQDKKKYQDELNKYIGK